MHRDSPRPVKRKGTERTDCPFYGQCLTFAVKRNWKHWSCGTCRNHMLAPIYKKRKYIEDYYELLAQIYPEFRKKYEHCMEAYDEPAT